MKKYLLTLLLCAAATLSAMAQWEPSDNDMKEVAAPGGDEGFYSTKILHTDDGKTICVYVKNINTDPDSQDYDFRLYYQVYDVNGNPTLPGEGVCVSQQPTEKAIFGHRSAALAKNGDILLTHTDSRYYDEKTQRYMPKVYLYRYTQTGESVWSKDGVELPDLRLEEDTLPKRFYKGPHVVVSGDNIYFACNYEETNNSGTNLYFFEIASLDQDGNIVASTIQENATLNYEISPAPDGSVYAVLPNLTRRGNYDMFGLKGQRLGPDLKNMWANEVVIEKENLAVIEYHLVGYTADLEDYNVATHKDGSLLMLYDIRIPPMNPPYLRYNRVMPDGTVLGEESVQTGDTLALNGGYDWIIEDDVITTFESRVYKYKHTDVCHLWMNRMKLDGTPLWEEDKAGRSVMMREDQVYQILGATAKEGIYYVFYFYANPLPRGGNPNGHCYVDAYDVDGNLLWTKPVLDGASVYDNSICYPDDKIKLLYTQNDTQGSGGVWLSYIDPADYTRAVVPSGLLPGEFSVNEKGDKVVFSQGNLQYRMASGVYRLAGSQNRALNTLNTFTQYPKNGFEFVDLLVFADDWGTHPLQNLGNKTDDWRVLTGPEWQYLLDKRPNADQKKALASLELDDEIIKRYPENGIVLLPDEFEMPEGLTLDCSAMNYYVNYFSKEDWAQMEANGAVFLVAAGQLTSKKEVYGWMENDRNEMGYYWTSSTRKAKSGALAACQFIFSDDEGIQTPSDATFIELTNYGGNAVRLVKDATPTGIENVKADAANRTKTVKRVENGRIVIESNGVTYNLAGQRIK